MIKSGKLDYSTKIMNSASSCILDKLNNQLDDLILLKEEDIDSMTAETYAVREYE